MAMIPLPRMTVTPLSTFGSNAAVSSAFEGNVMFDLTAVIDSLEAFAPRPFRVSQP